MIITVNNHVWTLNTSNDKYQEWHSHWWMQDGDGVEVLIKFDDNKIYNIEITCFSGFPASKIIIDKMDFNLFKTKSENEIEQAIKIADNIIIRLGLCKYVL